MLRYALYDSRGNELAAIDQREGGGGTAGPNGAGRTAQVAISFEDRPAMQALPPIARELHVWLNGVPLFKGPIHGVKKNGRARTVELSAKCRPSFRLERFGLGQRSDNAAPFLAATTQTGYSYSAREQSDILWYLVAHAEPTSAERGAGVPGLATVRGAIAGPARNRNRDYELGSRVWTGLEDLSKAEGAPDFDFEPRDDLGVDSYGLPYHYRFNTYLPYMGRDLSESVYFEWNTATQNLADFTHDPPGEAVLNRYHLQGQSVDGQAAAIGKSDQAESQLAHGILADFGSRSDAVFATTLKELSDEIVAALAWPPDLFEMVPAQDDGTGWARDALTHGWVNLGAGFGIPPRIGPGAMHDCWLGDLVHVVARDGDALDFDGTGRLVHLEWTELPRGLGVVWKTTVAPTVTLAGVA